MLQFLLVERLLDDLGEDVRLAQDEQVVAVDLHLGPAVLAVKDLVALGDIERNALLAVLIPGAIAYRDDLALLGLLTGGVGEHDAACSRLLLLDRLDDQAIAERLQVHSVLPPLVGFISLFWHSTHESAKRRWRV